MSPQTAADRHAKKAPAYDPLPPSFGPFNAAPYSSRDRTQEPFFPATIGSLGRNSPAPKPATAHQTMMVAICKTTGLMEMFNHKIDDLYNNSIKTNARVNLLSHAMEEVIETLNKNLVAFENLQKSINTRMEAPSHPATRPVMPLPPKPILEVVITRPRPTQTEPVQTAPAPPNPPTNPAPQAQPKRSAPPRKAKEGPKNYVDKPLTPPLHTSTAGEGPSRLSYATVAEGEFQPVIRKNRNHRNRTPQSTPANSPDTQPDRDRQIVVVRRNTEPTLNPALCLTIVRNICLRLQYTTCTGTISLVCSSAKGNFVLTTDPKHKAQDLWPYRKQISLGLNDSQIGPFDLQLNLMRLPIYISNLPLSYPNGGATNTWHPEDWTDSALDLLKKDISSSNAVEAVDHPFTIGTLASLKANRMTTCAFVVNLIRSPASINLLKQGHLTVGGRRAICREWFPDAHRSYCERCLSPGHHQIMCCNQSICKYCRGAHLSNRHRCNTCPNTGFCPSHDKKACFNCDSTNHFAGDERCPNRTLHRSIDPEKERGNLHDPTTTGRHHHTRPNPSRYGPPLPTSAEGTTRSRAMSISSEHLDQAIDNLAPSDQLRNLNNLINDTLESGEDPSHLIPDDDTSTTDHTDTHWRPCHCDPLLMDIVPCPNTRDAVYDISHDHPFCLCPPHNKEKRCKFFNKFIDEPISSTPADPQLTAILNTATQEIARQHNRTVTVTNSGRILVDGIDPDTPEYDEWTRGVNYRPHGDLCHCKAAPSNNVPRTHCPNRNSDFCPCYHLPGPVAGVIEISQSGKITTRRTPKIQTHHVAKTPISSRARSA